MIARKKKLIVIQSILFLLGIFIIIFTYYYKEQSEQIISQQDKKIANMLDEKSDASSDIFYNIKYSGIDLSGNRYILTSKEAVADKNNLDNVNMNYVEANFYFKDQTILNVTSNKGIYNNKTLDMVFENNVIAIYEGSKLVADKANYSNSRSTLQITDNVIVTDQKGIIKADKFLFDIKNKKLNIISLNNNKINAKINMK